MKKSNLIRIMLVILVFIWVGLKGQKEPEIIPFRLVPLNYEDNRKIELGIELIYPQKNSSLVEIHREETVDIISNQKKKLLI